LKCEIFFIGGGGGAKSDNDDVGDIYIYIYMVIKIIEWNYK